MSPQRMLIQSVIYNGYWVLNSISVSNRRDLVSPLPVDGVSELRMVLAVKDLVLVDSLADWVDIWKFDWKP